MIAALDAARPIRPLSAAYPEGEVLARYKLGRCTNGFERDKGRVLHAVPKGRWQAICGAEPGRRSAGWTEYVEPAEAVTCPKCMRALARQTGGASHA